MKITLILSLFFMTFTGCDSNPSYYDYTQRSETEIQKEILLKKAEWEARWEAEWGDKSRSLQDGRVYAGMTLSDLKKLWQLSDDDWELISRDSYPEYDTIIEWIGCCRLPSRYVYYFCFENGKLKSWHE